MTMKCILQFGRWKSATARSGIALAGCALFLQFQPLFASSSKVFHCLIAEEHSDNKAVKPVVKKRLLGVDRSVYQIGTEDLLYHW